MSFRSFVISVQSEASALGLRLPMAKMRDAISRALPRAFPGSGSAIDPSAAGDAQPPRLGLSSFRLRQSGMDSRNPYLDTPSEQLAQACARAAEDLVANRPRSREERLELGDRVRSLLLASALRLAPAGSWFSRPEARRHDRDFMSSLTDDHTQRLRENRYRSLSLAAEHYLAASAHNWLRDTRLDGSPSTSWRSRAKMAWHAPSQLSLKATLAAEILSGLASKALTGTAVDSFPTAGRGRVPVAWTHFYASRKQTARPSEKMVPTTSRRPFQSARSSSCWQACGGV